MWRMFLPNYFPGKSAWEQVGAARSRFKKFTSQVVLSGSVLRLKDAFTFNLKWVGFFFFVDGYEYSGVQKRRDEPCLKSNSCMLITDGLIYILDVSFTSICMHEIPTGVLCLPRAQFLQSCTTDLFYGWLNISPGLSSHNTPTTTTHRHDQHDHINAECGVCLFKKKPKRPKCSLFLLMWWEKIINAIITRNIVKLMTLLLKIEPITQDFRCHHGRKRILRHDELNCQ